MKLPMRLASVAAFATICAATPLTLAAAQQESVTISVQYPYPDLFKDLHQELADKFKAEHPEITVRFLGPAVDYEDATQKVLRGAVTNSLPDISFQGLNRIRVFVERDLAVPLEPLIAAESTWSTMGYQPATVALGSIGGKSYGLPFSISTPILYFNADLVRKAGGDPDYFPKTWPEVIALGKRIEGIDKNVKGIHFDYTVTGNWMFQALVFSNGGRMMTPDEKKVAFNEPKTGGFAFDTLKAIGEAGMIDMPTAQATQTFVAGTLGIYANSTAYITNATKQINGRFAMRTAPFPLPAEDGKLPSGGNVAMIFTKDKAKQKAAWEYVKFVTGPVGQTLMVKKTGYMPSNQKAIDDPELLGRFYSENPNHMTSIRQLPVMTGWYAFPGENALKITDVLKDAAQAIVTLKRPPADALTEAAETVQGLLPSVSN